MSQQKLDFQNLSAQLTNVNARKELNGEDRVPAFDMNFAVRVAVQNFKGLLPDMDSFIRSFYDEHKTRRCPAITLVKLDNDLVFKEAQLRIKDKYGHETTYDDCKVCKFRFKPGELGVGTLFFQVQYSADDEQEIVPAYKAEQQEGICIFLTGNPKEAKDKGDSDKQVDMIDEQQREEATEDEAA